uniref:Uncharacterized protein n=1 Tax=Opuntia streptacantha TaxID=393608 RepID=A0A7C9DLU1_OPUST
MLCLPCLSPIILSPSTTLSQSNLSAIPLSNSAICSYFMGRKVPSSKPNFSCSVPILHWSLGLQPDARYPTRSSLVSGSAATTASSVGGLAATIVRNPRASPFLKEFKHKNFALLAEFHDREDRLTQFSLHPASNRTFSQ